jgi:colanic acid biosynthesis glycosyl transferase WcaI
MHILIVSQWYPPEQAPIGYMMREIAHTLIQAGHRVTVITGFPNHPSGVVMGGYQKRWRLKENDQGVEIWRMWLYTSPRRGVLDRILTFLSFTLTSAWALLIHPRFDLVFAVFQPLSVGVTLPFLARLRRAKLVLNVQDLHPDAPIELGLIRNPWLIRILRFVETTGYRMADGLAVICDGFRDHCLARGAKSGRVVVIPNWIDVDEIRPGPRMNGFRRELGLDESHIVVLFAGTIGRASGAEVLLEAAAVLRTSCPQVRFALVGEGPLVSDMKARVEREGLSNVLFAPFQPRERLSEVQAVADVSLVTLLRDKGKHSVPSKVLGYMAAGRPVVAAVDEDSETARLVHTAGCGEVLEPENGAILAEVIARLADDEDRRLRLGRAGREHLEQYYRRELITARYLKFFEQVVEK